MLKFLAVALGSWAGAAWAAEPCQTKSGIPCFSLTYVHSVWALVQSPVRDLLTAEVSGTMAVREDGSFVHLIQPNSRFAVREREELPGRSTRLYLAGRLIVDQELKSEYGFRHPSLFFVDGAYRRSQAGDEGCRAMVASLFAQPNPQRIGTAAMLGEPVVNWRVVTKAGEYNAAVAPGLDCQILRLEISEYRYRYLPVRKELFEAKTVRRGEPAAALFTPPKGR